MIEWPELDALLEELRADNDERWQAAQELRKQFEQLQTQLQVLAQQYDALHVHDALQALNDRLLSGMGTIEMVQSGVGIEYVAALVWPASFDPRVSADESTRQGLYRIEVWLGPGMQDGQPRIRIAGEKRLEAKLPTSTERFRAALLSVFRSPQFVARTATPEGSPSEGSPSEEAAAETAEQAQKPEPDGKPNAARLDAAAEECAEPAVAAARDTPTEPEPGASAGPPTEPGPAETDEAIPLGPATDTPSNS